MRKRFKETEIINLLRAIEVKVSAGEAVPDACRSFGVSDKSYYRWRKLYGSMGSSEVRKCKELAKENRSFLISTHITSDLDRIADFVVVLDEGQVRLSVSREQLSDEYALCRGGRDVLGHPGGDTNGYFKGVQLNEFGFVALTTERSEVARKFGDSVVLERPTIEDLMIHTLKEEAR